MNLIVAKNYDHAWDFARVNRWSKHEWAYVSRPEQTHGRKDCCVYFIGPWWELRDSRHIEELIKIRAPLRNFTVKEVYEWR